VMGIVCKAWAGRWVCLASILCRSVLA
jgi:hypothetical protein